METLGLFLYIFEFIRGRYMPYYGREWITMLKNIKKHVLKAMYNYHYHMSNYCYGKVDAYGPERNAYWNDKVAKHINKEFELVNKLVQM